MNSGEKRSGKRSIAIFGLSANPPTGDEVQQRTDLSFLQEL